MLATPTFIDLLVSNRLTIYVNHLKEYFIDKSNITYC